MGLDSKRWGINIRVYTRTRYTTRYMLDDNPYPCFISVARNPRESILLSAATTHYFFFLPPLTLSTIDRPIFFPSRVPLSNDASRSSCFRFEIDIPEINSFVERCRFLEQGFFRSNSFRGTCCSVFVSSLMLDSDLYMYMYICVYVYICTYKYIYIRYCFRLEANLG